MSRDDEHRNSGRRVSAVSAALAVLGLLALFGGASQGASAPSADLSLTKTDSPDPVATGAPLTYSIKVANAGPDAATNVVVTDNLPQGVSFVSAESTQGSCAAVADKKKAQKVNCALGTLASSAGPQYNANPVAITIRVLAPQKAGTISNTASVAGDPKDPNKGNNSATATTQVIKAPVPTCGGVAATIVGTPGADVLTGSAGNDVVLAGASNDRIFTFGGKDLICAGAGSDLVKAGARSDEVRAGPGADRIFGGGGSDALRGGRGPDRIRGGRGADLLVGGPGRDRCFGGPGRDLIRSC
jgi:uncharacterized repeat protein (TIGR01451 family)